MTAPSRLIALTVAYALVWSASPGASAGAPTDAAVAAVVGFRTEGDLLEKQARTYLLKKLHSSDRVLLVPENVTDKNVQEFWRMEHKTASATLELAQKDYMEGKQLYEKLEVDRAIESLSRAVRGYREGIAALRDNRYLLASHLYLGMALVIRGRIPEGREYIRQMIILNPTRDKSELPPKEFPPKIVSLHKILTQNIVQGPAGTVSVRSVPSGASVYFDGVEQYPTPVDIQNVPAGEHFVSLERTGFRPYATRLEVKPGVATVDTGLEAWRPLSPQKFGARNDPEEISYLTELGEVLGAKVLVLGEAQAVSEDQLTLTAQLYDTRSKEFSKIERMDTPKGKIRSASEKLARALVENLTVSGGVVAWLQPGATVPGLAEGAPGQPPLQQGISRAEKPFYKTWWFWTIVGGAVVGGTAGIVLGTKSGADSNVLVIPNPL
jgi:hypothetical protein